MAGSRKILGEIEMTIRASIVMSFKDLDKDEDIHSEFSKQEG